MSSQLYEENASSLLGSVREGPAKSCNCGVHVTPLHCRKRINRMRCFPERRYKGRSTLFLLSAGRRPVRKPRFPVGKRAVVPRLLIFPGSVV